MTPGAPISDPLPHDPYAALRVADFRRFIACLVAQTVATMIQGVTVGWQVYEVTHDPLALGLVGLAEALPFIAAALPAGHLADQLDRRRVCLAALEVLAACSFALFGMTAGGLIRRETVWAVYAVIFASGLARSFLQPTRTALSADLVPRELYLNAITWRSSSWQFAAVAGPALGGLLVGFAGMATAYAVAGCLIGLAWGAMLRVESRLSAANPLGRGAAGFLEGVRFVRRQPVLLGAFTLDLFSVLFAGAEALLPIFATDILHVGAQGLGILRAAPAAGSVLMSLYLSHRPLPGRAGHVLLGAVALYGVCISGFGLSTHFGLSVLLLGLSGMFDNVSVVMRGTLLQTLTPRAVLGRVAGVNAIFIGSSNEVGAFESGVAARLIGTVPAVVLGGMVPLLVVATIAWGIPELRTLEKIG
ncbi:MAG TPA: MFS transporter [Gemmatimonadales bacterium]|nr:MFS transporter [Gemmatimonadales bacterium]